MRRLFPLVLFLLVFTPTHRAHAIDVTANDTASYIAAIDAINAAGPGVHTISILASFPLAGDPPTLTQIDSEINIQGNGHTIDGMGQGRALLLDAPGTTLTIQNLNVTNGRGPVGGGFNFMDGDVELVNVEVSNSSSRGNGGGMIVENNTLTLTNSRIVGNSSGTQGGGIYGGTGAQIILDGTTVVQNNRATTDGGGIGLGLGANLIMNDGQIIANRANATGGGVSIFSATLTMNGGEIRENNAPQGGGVVILGGFGAEINSTGGAIVNNIATRNGGGIYSLGGVINLNGITLSDNDVPGGFGGAIFTQNTVVNINGSTISGNGGVEGAITFNAIGVGDLTVTDSLFVNNTGAAIRNESSRTLTISNSCFLGNGLGISNINDGTTVDASGNWWGAPSGPEGFGETVSSDVVFSGLLKTPPFAECPEIPFEARSDYYSARAGTDLVIDDPAVGVIANDLNLVGVKETNTAAFPSARGGRVRLNTDGTFTYTPPPTGGIDAFEYQATTGGAGNPFGLVCISVSDLTVETPPPVEAEAGQPRNIRDIRVESSTPDESQVFVTVRARNGTLQVNVGDNGNPGADLTEDCDPTLFNNSQTTSNSSPSVVASSGGGGKQAPSAVLSADPHLQGNRVEVDGNNTAVLTLAGPKAAVNSVLNSLEYTSNQGFRGVDQVVVVATENNSKALGDVLIIVSNPDQRARDGGTTTRTPESLVAPQEPTLLRILSNDPGTIIRGVIPEGAVPNGDVHVRILAVNGDMRVSAAEMGDAFLSELGISQSAEVYGLTFGGVSIPQFTGTVTVCLRGTGVFYYRDATRAPRVTEPMQTFPDNGFTCTLLPNSGTVILVASEVAETVGANELQPAERLPLTDCMVTTRNILNLREGPGTSTAIVRPIQFNITLTALTFVDGWYEVDYLGQIGWISADFVRPQGKCGEEAVVR